MSTRQRGFGGGGGAVFLVSMMQVNFLFKKIT